MMDFGALPPEINSALMYSGAGPGPMLTAGAAWNELASALHSAATGYSTVISDLAGGWHGPSSESMAAAAAPYTAWMSGTAAQAELAGTQAVAAAAAYETAFAATVPPPVVTANRSLLAMLVATNILGQNVMAIAATEAHYAEMWAQDAAAMYGYAGSAATATQFSPFTEPPQIANPEAAAATQAVGTSAASTSSSVISSLESGLSQLSTMLGNLTGAYSPIGPLANVSVGWLTSMQILALAQNVPGVVSMLNGVPPVTGALGPLSGGLISLDAPLAGSAGLGATTASAVSAVSATSGEASLVGSLSVPSSWAVNAPAVKTLAATLPSGTVGAPVSALAAGNTSAMFDEMALSSLTGRAVGGTAVRTVAGSTARAIDRAPDTEALTTATILVIPVGGEE